jgi:predicted metal-dependent HD superfamily phosphohydrolase
MMDELLLRWRDLWQRLGAHSAPAPIFNELVHRYGETHRAYHTLEHIQDCLLQFDQVRNLAEHADEIELALWCHDVIYDPRAADNEIQSAAWAEKILAEGNLSADVSARVQSLILITQHHTPPDWADAILMVDIDLSILGRPPAEFDRYDAAIRQEYQWAPETAYREARVKVLESFLARPAIYQTAWFHDRYEAQARQNLTRAIRDLRRAGSEP